MDCVLPMRISYWTGWLDPVMVAVSKEVFQLLPHFPGSCAFGLSHHYLMRVSLSHRAFGLHARAYPLLRAMAPIVERCFDVSHVYTHLADWHFLRALGRRPVVLTVTQKSNGANPTLLSSVHHVVAQTEGLAAD